MCKSLVTYLMVLCSLMGTFEEMGRLVIQQVLSFENFGNFVEMIPTLFGLGRYGQVRRTLDSLSMVLV
jgi:hypothetical protein